MSGCKCGHVALGSVVTELRNWNPHCPEHGVGTDWYCSVDQVAKRQAQIDRLRDLQRQANEARRAVTGEQAQP